MPSRPWESLGLRPRDPLGPGRHYFFFNNALAGILIIVLNLTQPSGRVYVYVMAFIHCSEHWQSGLDVLIPFVGIVSLNILKTNGIPLAGLPSVPIFPGQSRFLDPVPGVPGRGEMSRFSEKMI